jgi:hypothetical protein
VDLNIYLLEQDKGGALNLKEFYGRQYKKVKRRNCFLGAWRYILHKRTIEKEDNQYFKYAYLRYGTGTNQTKCNGIQNLQYLNLMRVNL